MISRQFILILILLYQTNLNSAVTVNKSFNQKYLSNYLSALISFNSQNNDVSLKYFNSSKQLLYKHPNFINNYILSLIENGEIKKAINLVNDFEKKEKLNSFEGKILFIANEIKKKNFINARDQIILLDKFVNSDFDLIIKEVLYSYLNLFLNKTLSENKNNYGKLTLITEAFQKAYINQSSLNNFLNLINTDEGDYSRYLFFHLSELMNKNKILSAKDIAKTIDYFDSTLLLSQSKKWIEDQDYNKFKENFSFQNEDDLIAEFFFLIANLYNSQKEYKKSNFYVSVSNYLNPKFYFNLSLLAENYFLNNSFEKSKLILNELDKNDQFFEWYRIQKLAQIMFIEKNEENSFKFLEEKFRKIKNPSSKIYYDLANIYRKYKMYDKSIIHFNFIIDNYELENHAKANIFYRRGTCYERKKNYNLSDKDLLNSLKIKSENAYVLNYLAYSWLERDYKIDKAVTMLQKANYLKPNDAYISDSLGWAYYLNGNLIDAEKYMIQALNLKPHDPVILNHYGDILWKLGYKLQAKYHWQNTLQAQDLEDIDINHVQKKLIYGLN